MKRVLIALFAATMIFSFTACGEQSTTDNGKQNDISYDANDLDSIIVAMTAEFQTGADFIKGEAAVVQEKLGDSYETYDKNKEAVTDFYKSSLSKAEDLYTTTKEIATDYFKCVAAQGLEDYDTWDNAMEDFYDEWDDCMDDFYKAWDRTYDDIYDLCDDLIDDASDSLEYSEYSNIWSDMYSTYSDAWSVMYSTYSDAWSDTYGLYRDIWSGFYDNNTDVDALIKAATNNSSKNEDDGQANNSDESYAGSDSSKQNKFTEEAINPDDLSDTDTSGEDGATDIRPEFKEAMDSYEAFYDEYCALLKQYSANPSDLTLLGKYTDMLEQLSEMDEKFKAWDSDEMNDAELKYYLDVNSRITSKLLQVSE